MTPLDQYATQDQLTAPQWAHRHPAWLNTRRPSQRHLTTNPRCRTPGHSSNFGHTKTSLLPGAGITSIQDQGINFNPANLSHEPIVLYSWKVRGFKAYRGNSTAFQKLSCLLAEWGRSGFSLSVGSLRSPTNSSESPQQKKSKDTRNQQQLESQIQQLSISSGSSQIGTPYP
ncbi:unnamed protein product [Caretta caretta]